MADYRYLFYDLMSMTPTVELPLYGKNFTRQLGRSGNATGTFSLDSDGFSNQEVIDGTIAGRTCLFVERNGKLVWGGILWSRTWQETSKTFQWTSQTFESWLYNQIIRESIAFDTVDTRNILLQLVQHMQSFPASDIGIQVPAVFDMLHEESITFNDYEQLSYGRAYDQVADLGPGLDFSIDVSWGADEVPVLTAQIGTTLGTPLESSNLVFDYPGGNVTNFWIPESAARAGVSVFGAGQGSGEAMLRSVYTNPGYIEQGWPDIHIVMTDKDVEDQDMLDQRVQAFGVHYKPLVTVPTIQLNGSADPGLGSINLGDWGRLSISESARYPEGHESDIRIVGWKLTPGVGDSEDGIHLVIEEQELEEA